MKQGCAKMLIVFVWLEIYVLSSRGSGRTGTGTSGAVLGATGCAISLMKISINLCNCTFLFHRFSPQGSELAGDPRHVRYETVQHVLLA